MFIDILIIILFFLLRLPLPNAFEVFPIQPYLYRILADSLFLILFLLLLRIKAPLKQNIYAYKIPQAKDFLYGVLLAIVLLAISLTITQFLPNHNLLPNFFTYQLYPIFFLLILSSIIEELFYRGYLLSLLNQHKISYIYAIIITSLLFALGHTYMGWGGILFSSIAGMILGYTIIKFHSITIVMLGHVLYNVLAYTIFILSET